MKNWLSIFILMIFIHPLFSSAKTQENVEKIKVTGSRITRIDTQGPSPLVIYNKEDLENSGYSSAGDFLRDTTISHFGVSREEAGSPTSGESSASIKGETSLILINGIRLAEDPNGSAVDLNLIPIFAIERVEILKDGAAAIYGSDAVGGVINFITKKNFTGAEIHGQIIPTIYPLYKGGSRGDVATVFGKTYKKGSYIGSVHFRFQDSIENFERKWTNKTISPVGPFAVFNGVIDTNYKCERQTHSGKCEYNVADDSTRLPQYGQLYGYLQGNYKLNETTLYAQLITSYKDVKWSFAPVPGAVKIPAGHKMSGGAGQAGTLLYRFMEAGQRDSTYKTFTGDLTLGAKGYISPTWDYDFSLKLAHIIKNEIQEGLLLKEELTTILKNGVYDPFKVGEKGDLSEALYVAKSDNDSSLIYSSLGFSGETGLWNIGLATGLQAYFKNYDQNADEKAKTGKILSNAGGDGYGDRYVLSYYLEGNKYFSEMLEVQIAGRMDYYNDSISSNPLNEQIENINSNDSVSSDSQEEQLKPKPKRKKVNRFTINPKVAFRFKPHSQFLLRGSVGTAFVAPSLENLNQSKSEGYPDIFDTLACYNELKAGGAFNEVKESLKNQSLSEEEQETFIKDFIIDQRKVYNQKDTSKETKTKLEKLSQSFPDKDYCKYRQVFSDFTGNGNLKETKSIVASLGAHLQITDEHSFTVDLWHIRNDGISSKGNSSSGLYKKPMDAELRYGKDYVAKKSEGNLIINRNPNEKHNPLYNGPEHGMKTKLLNLGVNQISGVDFNWNSDMNNITIANGNPYFINKTSYIIQSQQEDFPGMKQNIIGQFGKPRWRNIATLGWKNKKHNVSLTTHTVSPFARKSSELENLSMYTRLDLDYQFLINEKTTFKFGWSNLFFTSPPTDDKADNGQLDHDIFEAKGPFFFAGIKHSL